MPPAGKISRDPVSAKAALKPGRFLQAFQQRWSPHHLSQTE
jgi:hypothetical protein